MNAIKTLLIIILATIGLTLINAQDTIEKPTPIEREYYTNRIKGTAPVIDGLINDKVWEETSWSGEFTQLQPYEGRQPSQPTRFKILYDDDNLYLAMRCFDSSPDSIEKRMCRRDGFDGDWIEVNIDSYHDLRTGFSFTVNAAGVKGDEAITNDHNWDATWDPIWYVKTSIDSEGWVAEMKIPLSQLRFGRQEEYIWGLQVNRLLFRKQERSSWQFIPVNASGWVHHFGKLHGIQNIKPQKQKSITPYAVGKIENYKAEEGNPFADGRDYRGSVGLDGKFGITNNLTLDFTINPDFGQVEADPSEVNLTTFETKFEEKRPFFIEGKNILNFDITGGDGPLSSDNLFYSRRIGKQPGLSPDLNDDEYSTQPQNTTILGAFKLTGKTKKGWSVGIMESVTEREKAIIDREGDRRDIIIEPYTNYFAGRLQKDMNESNTKLGGMVTATNRNLSTQLLQESMHEAAYTGGIDFSHQWKDQTYYLNASALMSQVQGSTEAIYKTQTSSPHFFQRPDAEHIEADSTRTSLSGWAGNVQFGRQGNSKWSYTFWITWRSPEFNSNDIGYVRRTDEIQQVAWVGFYQGEPFGIFRNFRLNFNQWYALTFGLEKLYFGGNFNAHWMFNNYWNMGGGYSRDGQSLSTSTLRGGPSLVYDGSDYGWIYMNTDQRKKIRFSVNYNINIRDGRTAENHSFNTGVRVQLSDAFNLSAYPGFFKRYDEIAYVETLDDLDNTRYIRGTLNQKQTQMTIRFNYNLTPDFTIQYYGMPFISSGRYNEFKYIDDPKADSHENRYISFTGQQINYQPENERFEVDEDMDQTNDYGFDDPNFTFVDFNSNLVVRWEYLPGSVLYLVWNQNRGRSLSRGNFDFQENTKDLFQTYPGNVFLIKLSYRIGL